MLARRARGVPDLLSPLESALRSGAWGDAALFMAHIGIPSEQIAAARGEPFLADLEAVARTLHYDHTELLATLNAIPREIAKQVTARPWSSMEPAASRS